MRVPYGVRPPWDPPEASEGPQGHFAFLSLKPYNMDVYGLVWTQLGHWYRYRGTFLVLNGTFLVHLGWSARSRVVSLVRVVKLVSLVRAVSLVSLIRVFSLVIVFRVVTDRKNFNPQTHLIYWWKL